MINHHPSPEWLQAFVAGELEPALAMVISSHVELCPQCKAHCAALEQQLAQHCWFDDETSLALPSTSEALLTQHDEQSGIFGGADDDGFAAMMAKITELPEEPAVAEPPLAQVTIKQQQYQLPRALRHVAVDDWLTLGKVARARVPVCGETLRSALIHIEAGGVVPQHTHKGFEITLLLDGSFVDDDGEYQAGDFIYRDASHQHQPRSEQGCLCLTVVSDSLQFTQGLSKLFNPVSHLLY